MEHKRMESKIGLLRKTLERLQRNKGVILQIYLALDILIEALKNGNKN
jgi:hypothetical protein